MEEQDAAKIAALANPQSASSSAAAQGSAAVVATPAHSTGENIGTGGDPVLLRLKQLEEYNRQQDSTNKQQQLLIEKLNREINDRDEKVKALSAEKRKDMEEFFNTTIQAWLSNLTDVSEEKKENFRAGIKRCAENADSTNPAWEIVCNASMHHKATLKQVEELMNAKIEQDKKILELQGFRDQASRISREGGGGIAPSSVAPATIYHPANMTGKRARIDNESAGPASQTFQPSPNVSLSHPADAAGGSSGNENPWDSFYNMMRSDGLKTYNNAR